jgi:hypothetical protein
VVVFAGRREADVVPEISPETDAGGLGIRGRLFKILELGTLYLS